MPLLLLAFENLPPFNFGIILSLSQLLLVVKSYTVTRRENTTERS